MNVTSNSNKFYFVELLLNLIYKVVNIFGGLGAICVLLLTVITTSDVIARYIFSSPLLWGFDVSQYIMASSIFLSIAYTEKNEAHVSVDFLILKLSVKKKTCILLYHRLIMLLVSIIYVFAMYEKMLRDWHYGSTTTGIIRIPKYPLDGIMCLSLIVLSTLLISKIFFYIFKIVRPKSITNS
ncbi:MAG: TRAP transporter small permease [Desulfovermiculus sp.]|nr:TRAP transporter small permease [Desulfovermiculus sp.]